MIDGLKIKVQNIKDNSLWLNHKGLDFALPVSNQTGEIFKDKPMLADCNGLTFRIKPSQTEQKNNFHIFGSLHRYHNGGGINTNDFNFSDVCRAVASLEAYHIDPKKTALENIEFGVNIALPFSCKRVLDAVVCMPLRPFTELRFEKTNIGKRADFQEYEVKIYDKGKQDTGKDTHLLRVELRVKKMQYLKKADIRTLSDLTNPEKLQRAGALLLNVLNEVIFFDYDLRKLETLPPSVKENVLKWSNAKWWQTCSRIQRHRQLKKLNEFEAETNTGKVKTEIFDTVFKKWCEMLGENESGFDNTLSKFLKSEKPKAPEMVQSAESCTHTPVVESRFSNVLSNFLKPETIEAPETVQSAKNGTHTPEIESRLTAKTLQNESRFDEKIESRFVKIESRLMPKCNDLSIKINGYNVTLNNKIIFAEKICKNCGCDISHKRPQSLYCSKRCKNAVLNTKNNQKRKQKDNQRESKSQKDNKSDFLTKKSINNGIQLYCECPSV